MISILLALAVTTSGIGSAISVPVQARGVSLTHNAATDISGFVGSLTRNSALAAYSTVDGYMERTMAVVPLESPADAMHAVLAGSYAGKTPSSRDMSGPGLIMNTALLGEMYQKRKTIGNVDWLIPWSLRTPTVSWTSNTNALDGSSIWNGVLSRVIDVDSSVAFANLRNLLDSIGMGFLGAHQQTKQRAGWPYDSYASYVGQEDPWLGDYWSTSSPTVQDGRIDPYVFLHSRPAIALCDKAQTPSPQALVEHESSVVTVTTIAMSETSESAEFSYSSDYGWGVMFPNSSAFPSPSHMTVTNVTNVVTSAPSQTISLSVGTSTAASGMSTVDVNGYFSSVGNVYLEGKTCNAVLLDGLRMLSSESGSAVLVSEQDFSSYSPAPLLIADCTITSGDGGTYSISWSDFTSGGSASINCTVEGTFRIISSVSRTSSRTLPTKTMPVSTSGILPMVTDIIPTDRTLESFNSMAVSTSVVPEYGDVVSTNRNMFMCRSLNAANASKDGLTNCVMRVAGDNVSYLSLDKDSFFGGNELSVPSSKVNSAYDQTESSSCSTFYGDQSAFAIATILITVDSGGNPQDVYATDDYVTWRKVSVGDRILTYTPAKISYPSVNLTEYQYSGTIRSSNVQVMDFDWSNYKLVP